MQEFPSTDPVMSPGYTAARDNSWAAITSLVIGILGLCGMWLPLCGWLFPIAGVIFGIIGIKSRQRTLAIIGIVLSGLVLLGLILISIFGFGLSFIDGLMSGMNTDFTP